MTKARVVPEIIGLPFHVARDVVAPLGLALANPDPDGPPVSAQAWPGLFYIVTQDPTGGERVSPGSSIKVTVRRDGDVAADVPVPASPPTPHLSASVTLDGGTAGGEPD